MMGFVTQVVLDNKMRVTCKRADESEIFESGEYYSAILYLLFESSIEDL